MFLKSLLYAWKLKHTSKHRLVELTSRNNGMESETHISLWTCQVSITLRSLNYLNHSVRCVGKTMTNFETCDLRYGTLRVPAVSSSEVCCWRHAIWPTIHIHVQASIGFCKSEYINAVLNCDVMAELVMDDGFAVRRCSSEGWCVSWCRYRCQLRCKETQLCWCVDRYGSNITATL